ncbi:ankyrin repeat-containing protein BDA1-like [Rhodamnia argentea]|uniref:Ankyrin repeat-containing protein BDA1-like n=1 Tax=Rhodamnia argentea TaxID=178133 RepID=A0ABM3HYW3_9MYRT|nr:ankyrin repeat-containing protein BDA1-like [Rhodamnia argentea]
MGKKSPARLEEEKARESELQRAIDNDDVDKVYAVIAKDPKLLGRVSDDPFQSTPLHSAAASGNTQVAMEMAILKPLLSRKLNADGYSPMHVALKNRHYHTVRALITLNPKLIRVRGRCGMTPLHCLAEKEGDNELELLAEFLCACKSSIKVLTSRCETAVHVAVKKGNIKAFEVLFGWLKRVYMTEILNWKDEDGNTVLHIAEAKNQTKIINLLRGYVKANAKNFQGKTAWAISPRNPSRDHDLEESRPPTLNNSLSQFLRSDLTFIERNAIWFGIRNKSARSTIPLVASLIATATYQAALTPPGGYWSDNSSNAPANSTVVPANSSGFAVEKPHLAGKTILSGADLCSFLFLNGTVFLAAISAIWITAIPRFPHTLPVYLLLFCVGFAFIATTAVTAFPKSYEVGGELAAVVLMILLGAALIVPMTLWLKYNSSRGGIDATWRRVGNFVELEDRK